MGHPIKGSLYRVQNSGYLKDAESSYFTKGQIVELNSAPLDPLIKSTKRPRSGNRIVDSTKYATIGYLLR